MENPDLTYKEREDVITRATKLPFKERVELLKEYGLYRSPEELKHLACEITARFLIKRMGMNYTGGVRRVGAGTGTEGVC